MEEAKNTKSFTGMSGKTDPTKVKWSGKYKENEMSFAQGGLGGSCAGGESLEEGKKKRKSSMATKGIAMFPDKGGPTAISRFNNSVGDATGIGTSAGAGTSGGATSGSADGGAVSGGGDSFNKVLLPVLQDALRYYSENAFGYDGIEDYVNTDFEFYPDEAKKEVIEFIKSNGKSYTGLNEVLNRRILENNRLKIALDCNIPASSIQLYDNGKFHIYNISEYDANKIYNRLMRNSNYSNINKIAGLYDFGHLNNMMQPSRRYEINGMFTMNLDEGIIGDLASNIKTGILAGKEIKKDKKAVVNKIFAGLWEGRKSKPEANSILANIPKNGKFEHRPIALVIDEAIMKKDEVIDNIKKLAPVALKLAPYEIFREYDVFSSNYDDTKNTVLKYSNAIKDKETINSIINSIKSQGLEQALDARFKAYKSNDSDKAADNFKVFLYWLYSNISTNKIKVDDSNKEKYLTTIENKAEENKFNTNVFDEIDKLTANQNKDKYLSNISSEAKPLAMSLSPELLAAIYYNKLPIIVLTKNEALSFGSKTLAGKWFKKECFEADISSVDLTKLATIAEKEALKAMSENPELADIIDLDDNTTEALKENDMNLHDHDQLIDYILNELDKKLEWMIYDGICSRPELEDNKIILTCDPEPEIKAEMNRIIKDVCNGTKAKVEDEGDQTVIDFNLYEDLIIPTDTEEDYVLDGFLDIPEEDDCIDYFNNKCQCCNDDPYVKMQFIDADNFDEFDDISPFEHNYINEYEDDDTFENLDEGTTKKLTLDQLTKIKDAVAKGDADGVAALANSYAAANDPAKASKAKELGINLMS